MDHGLRPLPALQHGVCGRHSGQTTALDERPPKIYLAGFDVFRLDAVEHGEHLKALCRAHQFEGLYPLDAVVDATLDPAARARRIFERNIAEIRRCDVVMANLADFRGAGEPDVGTAFEVGFAVATGKLVFGYMPDIQPLTRRVSRAGGDSASPVCDRGYLIENFDLPVNLMLACATTIVHGGPEACLEAISKHLGMQG